MYWTVSNYTEKMWIRTPQTEWKRKEKKARRVTLRIQQLLHISKLQVFWKITTGQRQTVNDISGTTSLWRWRHYAPTKRQRLSVTSQQSTQPNISQDTHLHQHCCENLKSGISSRPRGEDKDTQRQLFLVRVTCFKMMSTWTRLTIHTQQSSLLLRMNHDWQQTRCEDKALPAFRFEPVTAHSKPQRKHSL